MNFFITATDTDVGKTFVTTSLLLALQRLKIKSIALKPVQTGCEKIHDKMLAPDVAIYCSAVAENNIQPCYSFQLPASPHYAAQKENQVIDIKNILSYIKQYSCDYEIGLIEGAGGIFVPLNQQETMLDLMRQCNLPIILVCPNRLGILNNILMNIEILKANSLTCAGLILNFDKKDDEICKCNREYLQEHIDIPIVAIPNFSATNAIEIASDYLQDFVQDYLLSYIDNSLPENNIDTKLDTQFDREHLWHPYTHALNPLPTYPVISANRHLIHIEGKDLIDGMSSWWCALHGYNNSEINRAAIKQLSQLSHVMFAGLTHKPAIDLGKKLLELLPDFNRIFYSDSGSVSVEVALKLALQYQQSSGKDKILTVLGGYHGDTQGAMSVCDPNDGMHAIFNGVLAKHIFAPRPLCRFDQEFNPDSVAEIESIFENHKEKIAAVIIEPIVQGAGGMWFYHPQYLQILRKLCDKYGALLIFDEIATGFGRTGKMFAYQYANVVPDIICIGKGLSAGYMTFAATLCQEHIAQKISHNNGVFMHGPTFMANPLACAISLKSIELLEKSNWQENVMRISNTMKKHLSKCKSLPETLDVRVLGAIGVVELSEYIDIATIQEFFVSRNVWIRPFGKLIYLMPPFIIPNDDLIYLCQVIFEAIQHKKYKGASC